MLAGVEHEFFVLHGGSRVDFVREMGRLDLGRRFLDPADAHARRTPSGAAVTADGTEAEIALPPIDVKPGFAARAAAWMEAERVALIARLGDGYDLEGSSSHIGISVPAPLRFIEAVARVWTGTFAPAFMLLLDRSDSYGIYVRPRPGRLELCGEHATGAWLSAAMVFAAGSVRAAVGAAATPQPAGLPPAIRMRLERCTDRYGYLVHRRSMGGDLYATGRATELMDVTDTPLTAQRHLEVTWAAARAALAPFVEPGDLSGMDDVVAARTPLPRLANDDAGSPLDARSAEPNPFGRVARPMARPGYDMAAVMITWDAVVLVAAEPSRSRPMFISVPRSALAGFLERLDAGALDHVVLSYLRSRPRGRALEQRSQLRDAALFDTIGPRRSLLARERNNRGAVTRIAA